MLTSDQSAEYRQSENARVWEYQCKKKAQSTIPPSQTVPAPPPPIDDPTDTQEKVKEQSQLQYIKYVKYFIM